MTSLSSNSDEWPEEIVTKIKERIPSISAASLSIKFMKEDEEIGAATGSITVVAENKTAVIPIIIKDFKMYPLDVFFAGEKVLPLTNDFFIRYMAGSDAGKAFGELEEFPNMGVHSRFLRGDSLAHIIYPPNWGRYAYASDSKYPIIDEISKTIDGEQWTKTAKTDPATIARYYNSGNLEIMQKIANLKPVNMQEFRQGVDNLVVRTINVLKKNDPNNYTLLSTQSNQFNPAMSSLDRLDVRKFVSKADEDVVSFMHDLDANGEKVLIPENQDNGVFVAMPEKDRPELAESFGMYNIRTESGVNVEGLVIPKVVDFDQNPVGTKTFLGKGFSTMQADIAGHPIRDRQYIPEGNCPTVGQTGTFFYNDDGKDGLCTVPVTVRSVMRKEGPESKVIMQAVDLYGEDICICIPDECSRIQKIVPMGLTDKGIKKYHIPSFMRWVPMEGFTSVANSPADYEMKVAAAKTDIAPVRVIQTGYGEYAIRGLDKYAHKMDWDPGRLQSHQAKFLLAAVGANEETINEGFKYAALKGSADFHGTLHVDTYEEKIASVKPKAEELVKKAEELRKDTVKEASYMDSSQTVDALLSLNFISAQNLSNFISKIPIFKATLSHLCSCLLGARLGVREIPEESTASAISKLIDVLNGLEALRAMHKPKGSK